MKTSRKHYLYACLVALLTFVSPLFSEEKETIQGIEDVSEEGSGFLGYVYVLLNRLAISDFMDAPVSVGPCGGFTLIEDCWLEIQLIEQQRECGLSQKKKANLVHEN